jgi:hypothetical protein
MDNTPLIDDLEILGIFKDEDRKEGDGVTDAISIMLRLLREELKEASWLIRARSRIELVKLYNEEW